MKLYSKNITSKCVFEFWENHKQKYPTLDIYILSLLRAFKAVFPLAESDGNHVAPSKNNVKEWHWTVPTEAEVQSSTNFRSIRISLCFQAQLSNHSTSPNPISRIHKFFFFFPLFCFACLFFLFVCLFPFFELLLICCLVWIQRWLKTKFFLFS